MPYHSLLQLADHSGREARAQREDLRAMLFPASERPPTEREVAGLRHILVAWVSDIERALLDGNGQDLHEEAADRQLFPVSWKTLTASGLLSDDLLISEAQNRLFLADLHGPDASDKAQNALFATLGRMADDENTPGADAARILLSAHLRLRSSANPSMAELPATLLSLLAWRIVAAHEVIAPGSRERMAPRVAELLSAHDEGRRIAAAAQRLAHRMAEGGIASPRRPELWPEMQGLPLSLALLSVASDLSLERLMQLSREAGAPRLALVLRALDYEEREARRLIAWLAVNIGGEQAAYATIDAYGSTGKQSAEQMLARLRADPSGGEDAA